MTVSSVTAISLASPASPLSRDERGTALPLPEAARAEPLAPATQDPFTPSPHSSAVYYEPGTPALYVPATYTIPGLASPHPSSAFPPSPAAAPPLHERINEAYAAVAASG